jgi:hypothetical protein
MLSILFLIHNMILLMGVLIFYCYKNYRMKKKATESREGIRGFLSVL